MSILAISILFECWSGLNELKYFRVGINKSVKNIKTINNKIFIAIMIWGFLFSATSIVRCSVEVLVLILVQEYKMKVLLNQFMLETAHAVLNNYIQNLRVKLKFKKQLINKKIKFYY